MLQSKRFWIVAIIVLVMATVTGMTDVSAESNYLRVHTTPVVKSPVVTAIVPGRAYRIEVSANHESAELELALKELLRPDPKGSYPVITGFIRIKKGADRSYMYITTAPAQPVF